MKDADDWAVTLETVDALFCSVADGIASGTGMSLEAWSCARGNMDAVRGRLLQAGWHRRQRWHRALP